MSESSHLDEHQYEIHRIKAPGLQMAIILAGVFMAVMDTSVVTVAIPKLETDLSAGTDQIQWVLTGYLLVQGVVVPISGWLTDRFGAKRLLIFSLITFTIGSALCGMAWNLDSMIFFRILQAAGGGFMMPVANAMIFRIFPPNRRGAIMGIFGITIMAAPAFGPALGGYFVQYASWRLIFYINVPVGIVASIMAIFILHEFPHESKEKLDILGFILSTGGFFSLLLGFSEVSQYGWGSLRVYPFIFLGAALLILLVTNELLIDNPLIQLRVLKNYMFSMGLVISSIMQVALFVGIFLLPLYLQNITGYTAFHTGLFLTPAALVSMAVMPISGKLFDKIGARPLGVAGLAIVALSTYGFSQIDLNSSSTLIQTLYTIRMVGMSMVMMPVMTAGMNTLKVQFMSQASAMNNTIRMVAASLGTALLTSYMTTQSKIHSYHLADKLAPNTPQGLQFQNLQRALGTMGIPSYADHSTALMMVYGWIQKHAFVQGMDDTYMAATILSVLAFVLVLFYSSAEERAIRAKKSKASGSATMVAE